ncbi:methyltransferase small domain protein [Ancylostoma caninum]|uniref:Methyltransferase-like protein 5 n=1 Tax=Ancylostoma caninum TaxID=29170 RepID=A0A368G8U7_ANCCA|nr:methyltransferase small domain protein [Ancylostoma caninum]
MDLVYDEEDYSSDEAFDTLLMKPKRLEWMLSELRGFEKPDIKLEQYETSPELAIAIVDCIDRLVGLDGQFVADLGCGCGMLMSAVALAHEPAAVLGFDIDKCALSICKENLEDLEVDDRCDLVRTDVLSIPESFRSSFDVVVMNPPFGTKSNAGMDLSFVKAGLAILRPGGSLFSLHKSSTRDHILKTANKWENADVGKMCGTIAVESSRHLQVS